MVINDLDKNDENKENTHVKKVIEVLFEIEDDTDQETIIWDLLFGDNEEFVEEESTENDTYQEESTEDDTYQDQSAGDDTYQEESAEDEDDTCQEGSAED
uniref:DNA primase n=1 Tax=Strongyloides papillosus TaxID=174720 RepID=A0A0N5BYM0_STREA